MKDLLIKTALLCLLATSAIASPTDANKDGVITKQEFLSHQEQLFNKKDKNKDGQLTKDEMPVHKQRTAKQQPSTTTTNTSAK